MQKAIRFLLFFLLLSGAAGAQTAKLQPVKGTRYSLVPPKDFVPATLYKGFEHPLTGATIVLTELPVPFEEMSYAFEPETLKMGGMTFIDKDTVDFNDSKAYYITATQKLYGTLFFKQIFIFGNDKEGVMVVATCQDASKSKDDLKAALFTTALTTNTHPQSNNTQPSLQKK